ncbi:hypothetical protein HN011_008931 [Eciton burchellii]|nr:hypothetical protein HN011_008931 [Eciton burchellii]
MVRCKHIDSQTVGTIPPLSCYTAIRLSFTYPCNTLRSGSAASAWGRIRFDNEMLHRPGSYCSYGTYTRIIFARTVPFGVSDPASLCKENEANPRHLEQLG